MNIFLPYENNIEKSVQSLDDRRLIKQILECKQLLDVALGKSHGYENHPVAVHYKDNSGFLAYYGYCCCEEYWYRFGKFHKFTKYFIIDGWNKDFIPFYAEYPKTDSRCIRTTNNVSKLFKEKLIKKWNTDKIQPKWTNRNIPKFYLKLV